LDLDAYDVTCKDGSVRIIRFSVAPIGTSRVVILYDLTESNRVAKALQESRQLLETAQAFGQIGSWTADAGPESKLAWSDETCRLFGFAPGEFDGASETFFQMIHSEDRERVRQAGREATLAGKPAEAEFRILRRDGQLRWIYQRADTERDATGRPLRKVGVVQDITGRKQAEAALQASETRLKAILENSRDAFGVHLDGTWVLCNPAAVRMFGRSAASDLLGTSLLNVIAPGERERIRNFVRSRTEEADTPQGYITRGQRADGTEFDMEVAVSKFRIEDKTHVFVILRDITERKHTEDQIKRLASELKLILETIPVGISFLQDRMVKTANVAHDQLFGYALGETVGLGTDAFYTNRAEYDRMGREIYPALARGEIFRTESEMRRKDGSPFTARLTGQAIDPIDLAAGSIWMVEDITRLKLAEAEKAKLEEQNRLLQKTESLGRMAGAIAHNFNNQLQSVTLGLEMAIEDQSKKGHPDANNLTEVLQSVRKAAGISHQMLVYLGQTHVKHESLDLSETCRRSLPLLAAAMPKQLSLVTDLPVPGPWVCANADQLQQVFTNLLTNAWEASHAPSQSIRLSVAAVPAAEIPIKNRFPVDWQPQASAYASLTVEDAGCGIADSDIEKLFDPFFTTKFAGRGLGLPVALGIVREHLGSITVASNPGQGSLFRVFLPVTETAIPPKQIPLAPVTQLGHQAAVLVVEDDAALLKVVTISLKRQGFPVFAAVDGVEAVALFEKHREAIGCVLCDLTMPRMGGWETLIALRRLAPGMPAILTSGFNETMAMESLHSEMPQAYLSKPYEIKTLISTIKQVMSR